MAMTGSTTGRTARPWVGRLAAPLVLLCALAVSVAAALLMSRFVENENLKAVAHLLSEPQFEWLHAEPNGLLIELSGQAPGKVERLVALTAVRSAFKPSRIVDGITLAPLPAAGANAFAVRLLRHGDRVQVFGEIPDRESRDRIIAAVKDSGPVAALEDWSVLHEVEPSAAWDQALEFGLRGLELVPGADLHLSETAATIEGGLASQEELDRVRSLLNPIRPPFLSLDFRVAAPRPLHVPYLFDLQMEDGAMRLAACHADSEADRARILAELEMHGTVADGRCELARGAPSGDWVDAIATSLSALRSAGGGRLRIEGFNVFAAPAETGAGAEFTDRFNAMSGSLPDRFVARPASPEELERRAAGRSRDVILQVETTPEHRVELSGRAADEEAIQIISSFVKVALAPTELVISLETDSAIDVESTGRVLAGLEALALLHAGMATVGERYVEITGYSGRPYTGDEVSALLSKYLDNSEFAVNVDYDAYIAADAPIMDPRLCVSLATEIVESNKLTFDPGSANLSAAVYPTIRQLAVVLQNCTHARIEIGGHTDNQGREEMNLALSTRRARAVLDALLAEGVLTQNFVAVGYGESIPIADNGTEEGRDRNRRIEFRLRSSEMASIPQ